MISRFLVGVPGENRNPGSCNVCQHVCADNQEVSFHVILEHEPIDPRKDEGLTKRRWDTNKVVTYPMETSWNMPVGQ